MTRSSNCAVAGLAKSVGVAALLAVGMPAGGAMAHVDREPICEFFTATGSIKARCRSYHRSSIVGWVDIPHQHYTPPTYEPRLPDGY